MLVVAGTVTIDPEKREEGIAAAREMMAETRKEPGNIEYAFSADLLDPGVFRIYEEWQSQEALDFHFGTPHMAKFQATIGGLGLKDMKVQKLEIASVGPVF